MELINSLEGLLFRTYLTNGHFRLIQNSYQIASDDIDSENYRKAAGCSNSAEMKQKIAWAHEQTVKAMDWATTGNIQVLPFTHPLFPRALHQLKDCPPLLFMKGQLPQQLSAAVVGTRNASPLASGKVKSIVNALVQKQLGIISGLALGIDTLSHEAALKAHTYTLAILPRSLDQIYPPENKALASLIVEAGGGLLSELPPGLHPGFNPFVHRNRLQAALSQFIISVEMGIDSGTRYTIQYGVKYNKQIIMCLPNKKEIDQYLPQHEGLLPAIKKYKPSGRLHVLQNWSQLPAALCIVQTQPRLF